MASNGMKEKGKGKKSKTSVPLQQAAAAADDSETAEEVDPENEASLPMMPSAPAQYAQRPGYGQNTGVGDSRSSRGSTQSYTGRGVEQFKMKAEPVERQPAPTGMLAWVGYGCCVFALVCLCISFASPYWLQCWPNSFNNFRNLGLWQVCFHDYMHHKDDSQEIYNGCWWVFDREKKYSKLREWLAPPWFISCQVMVTGTLLVEVGTAIVVGMIFLHCCPIMNHEYLQTYGMFAASAMMFLVTLITLITAIIFGAESQDRYWMPRPDLNFLSWGFGFYIISGIMSLAAGVCFFYQAWKIYNELLEREMEFTKAALEMSGYPMSTTQSQGYPDYSLGRPSLGSQASYEPSYGKPSYSQQGYDEKQSYATQPSFDGKHSLASQQSYDRDYYDQPGYRPDPYAPRT